MKEELEKAARVFVSGYEQREEELSHAFKSGAMWAFAYLDNAIKIMCENNKFDNHGKEG